MKVYFSDFFDVSPDVLEEYGALDISLIADLPLFVDPFLLFNSEKPEYRQLHEEMIDYIRFLKAKADSGPDSRWFDQKLVHLSRGEAELARVLVRG